MSCYKDGGCGIYEMYSCYECPASKPEYLKRKSREPQRLQAIGNLHDVAKQILDDEVVILLRQYGTTLAPGRMEMRVVFQSGCSFLRQTESRGVKKCKNKAINSSTFQIGIMVMQT